MRITTTALAVIVLTACATSLPRGMPNTISAPNVTGPYEQFPLERSATTAPALYARDGGPDSTLMYQEALTASRYVRTVGLRLPMHFAKVPDVVPIPPNAEAAGGLRIATWTVLNGTAGTTRKGPGVTIWIDPRRNVPTVGADPGTTQTAFAACTGITVNGQAAEVVVFTLVPGPNAASQEPRSYLAAFWPAPGGRYLQFLASAPDPAGLAPFHRALLDVKVTGP